MTALYRKEGRRYVLDCDSLNAYDRDMMKPGQFRLTYAYQEGGRRYDYAVTPDTASFLAACIVARQAMEDAMNKAAVAQKREEFKPYTKKQLAVIEKFRAEMAAVGGLLPTWWGIPTVTDIAQAGIDAVVGYKP
jgi:hypothetical protein